MHKGKEFDIRTEKDIHLFSSKSRYIAYLFCFSFQVSNTLQMSANENLENFE